MELMKYKTFVIKEATIDDFMGKINNCQTVDGLDELEKYYKTRSSETDIKDSDDIAVRDAIEGKRSELENTKDSDEEESEESEEPDDDDQDEE